MTVIRSVTAQSTVVRALGLTGPKGDASQIVAQVQSVADLPETAETYEGYYVLDDGYVYFFDEVWTPTAYVRGGQGVPGETATLDPGTATMLPTGSPLTITNSGTLVTPPQLTLALPRLYHLAILQQ